MLNKKLLYSAYRVSTCHLAPDGSEKVIHGTCFHVKADERLFLITNRHNVDLSYKDQKYVGYRWNDVQVSGYCNNDDYFEFSFTEHALHFSMPQNPAEDVFVFEIPKTPIRFRRRKKPGEDPNKKTEKFEPVTLGFEMLATEEDMKRLSPGSPVLLPSYSAHYDLSSERPVMRGGIVSSDPESNYQTESQEPARRVLYQTQSTEGASGGPVFALMDDTAVLLGVNAGHLTGSEPKIGTIHSGFSYCFKAVCIREAIDAILSDTSQAHGR
jgi:Trypsin-like peptidase domain